MHAGFLPRLRVGLPENRDNARFLGRKRTFKTCASGLWVNSRSQQFVNHLARFERWDRAAGVVEEVERRVNAQHVVHRVMDVGRGDGAVLGDFASFEVCQLSSEVLRTTIDVLERCELRASDAIHVASAIEAKASKFASSDTKQIAAAKKFNLTIHSV